MISKQTTVRIVILAISCMALGSTSANAQYTISWFTIASGGGNATGGNFALEGTIGQHDAGPVMTGGEFQLTGGFWAGVIQNPHETVADSINIFRGVLIGGDLSDSFESDDSYLKFNPGFVINSSEAPVWLIFDGTLPNDNPNSLAIVKESTVGTPGLTCTLEAWNWTSAAYDVVDVSVASFNEDVVVTADLSSGISDFTESGSGAVRTRVGCRKTGFTINYPWEVRLDQLVWIVQ